MASFRTNGPDAPTPKVMWMPSESFQQSTEIVASDIADAEGHKEPLRYIVPLATGFAAKVEDIVTEVPAGCN